MDRELVEVPQLGRLKELHRQNISGSSVSKKPSRLGAVIGPKDAPMSIRMTQGLDHTFRTIVRSQFSNLSGRERRDSNHIRLHLDLRSDAPPDFALLTPVEERDASWISFDADATLLFTDYIERILDTRHNLPVVVRGLEDLARDLLRIFTVAEQLYLEVAGYDGRLYVGLSLTNLWGAAVQSLGPPQRQAQVAAWHTELELAPGRTKGNAIFHVLSGLLRDLQYAESEQPVREALERLGCDLQLQQQQGGRVAVTVDHVEEVTKGPTPPPAQRTGLGGVRLSDLADNVRQDMDLLKQYEDALRYEDDPRRRTKYRREIQRLRESAARHRQEYDEVQAEATGEPSVAMRDIASQLQEMDSRLNALLEGQTAIRDGLTDLRRDLLARFDSSERTIITSVVERLSHSQLAAVQAVLDRLETQSVSEEEILHLLDAAQQMMAELQQQAVVLPGQQELAEVIAAPTLDAKHKLKVTLPIIPLLLAYEGEIELRSGLNLDAAWKRLVTRIRGD